MSAVSRPGFDFRTSPIFRDRVDAGAKLATALGRYRDCDALVLGIPRGGVPVAAEVARALGAELDVIVSRKLGAPGYPELALGAVTADGVRWLNTPLLSRLEVHDSYLKAVTLAQWKEAQQRRERFRGSAAEPQVAGRVVIVVDDGLATGATMHAALRSLRRRAPALLVVAVPVGSREACEDLRREAEVICLHQPLLFHAVGQFYQQFPQTSDEEVQELLQRSRERGAQHGHPEDHPRQAVGAGPV